MSGLYKTPGVYVEEIPKFPPSIAAVETAIPAFIGYTKQAQERALDDLLFKPKRIGSRVEFELYYGGAPSPEISEININANNEFVSANVSNQFFMYDSLQMFYNNGGGDCYIVSVGDYDNPIDETSLIAGITALEKEDVPTILLFPDAVGLTDDKLANVQQAALSQCEMLQDRVTVLDVKQGDAKGVIFRNKIGINNLKYGMVYTPWLKVSLPKDVKYPAIKLKIRRSTIPVTLSSLTSNTDIQNQIAALEAAITDKLKISTKTNALNPPNGSLMGGFINLESIFNGANSDTTLQNIFLYVYGIAGQIDKYIKTGSADLLTNSSLKTDVTNAVTSSFDVKCANVVTLEKKVDAEITSFTATTAANIAISMPGARWLQVTSAATAAAPAITWVGTDLEKRIIALDLLKVIFGEIEQAYLNLIVKAADKYSQTLDDSLALQFPLYKSILSGVMNSSTAIPPSGAIAGIYALTDRTRGVWKAPANVSLNNVIAPDETFTNSELELLNVDSVAGKSINAIRAFSGKGTLVFGARTLAGNDNEWRYISVRRFFNFVEESVKKATEQFVFEPNDANTWVKVQAMIENFLNTLWRQGALQGVKPEHAFYVAVGLGKTMTALDILEGRMIIEIGMAAVRPAEFIILKFSHKMAES